MPCTYSKTEDEVELRVENNNLIVKGVEAYSPLKCSIPAVKLKSKLFNAYGTLIEGFPTCLEVFGE
jgi:hypothetical protein